MLEVAIWMANYEKLTNMYVEKKTGLHYLACCSTMVHLENHTSFIFVYNNNTSQQLVNM